MNVPNKIEGDPSESTPGIVGREISEDKGPANETFQKLRLAVVVQRNKNICYPHGTQLVQLHICYSVLFTRYPLFVMATLENMRACVSTGRPKESCRGENPGISSEESSDK